VTPERFVYPDGSFVRPAPACVSRSQRARNASRGAATRKALQPSRARLTSTFAVVDSRSQEETMPSPQHSHRYSFATLFLLLGIILILGHGLWAFAQGGQSDKAPEPDKAAQAKAETLVRGLFKDKLQQAKTDPAVARMLS